MFVSSTEKQVKAVDPSFHRSESCGSLQPRQPCSPFLSLIADTHVPGAIPRDCSLWCTWTVIRLDVCESILANRLPVFAVFCDSHAISL